MLPPGQQRSPDFPRFGLPRFASRFPADSTRAELRIGGEIDQTIVVTPAQCNLQRVERVADFHCVTTWSVCALRWSGFRFADFFRHVIEPRAHPHAGAGRVVFRGQDGYRSALLLDDLMADDVLLADTLNGLPLDIDHGAPLRLVAPAHYGYKAVKHLSRIDFMADDARDVRSGLRFMDHPRARVAHEERTIGAPGWVFRWLYRPMIKWNARRFRRAMLRFEMRAGRSG